MMHSGLLILKKKARNFSFLKMLNQTIELHKSKSENFIIAGNITSAFQNKVFSQNTKRLFLAFFQLVSAHCVACVV
jgi:hypothetical protein